MTAAALFASLADTGIRLSRNGDRLHVESKPGALTAELRDRLTANKPDLMAMLAASGAIRAHLLTLAESEGLPAVLVHDLDSEDLAGCAGCTNATLRAFLRALNKAAAMNAGRVPASFTVATRCPECGPVWLSEAHPPEAKTCPWCFRRRAGKAIPRQP